MKTHLIKTYSRCIAAAGFLGLSLLAPLAQAQGHDSNSFHKFGKAIQYPFRKASENTSITAHRAVGQRSVEHRRNGNKTYRAVVGSNGRLHRLPRVGPNH